MEKRIYYHDTDAGGVVYYGRYLNYLEEARTLYLEKKGIDIAIFREKRFLYAVRKCTIDYKSPAIYGDTICCSTKLTKITAVQLTFEQLIHEKQSTRLILEAEIIVVSLNKDFKPTPIPEDIKSKLT